MKFIRLQYVFVVAFMIALVVLGFISRPPEKFPTKSTNLHIEENTSLNSLASILEENNIISSTFLFKATVVILGGQKSVKAGDYLFERPEDLWHVAFRTVKGDQGQPKISITIPEGTNVKDISKILDKKIPNFDEEYFVSLASKYEGYLFPDTYYFFKNARPEIVVQTMTSRFNEKIKEIEYKIKNFDKPLADIVNMASIVEKESYPDESRRIIAGILWKRLEKNMPLQVDAPFYYITGKPGNFTQEDLKIDSPYNTYIYKGLPKGPISNPGLASILDTVTPLETPYWFYLTDKNGEMRYAKDYDGHLANIDRYLK